MQMICDLHIHSKYSAGASKKIDIFTIALNSMRKGIKIIGSGDCLHPYWLNHLKSNLIEYSAGVYYIHNVPNVYFVLQTEIEVIWKHNSHLKKVHFIVLFPNFEKIDEVVSYLSNYGNLSKNGRLKVYTTAENLIHGLKFIDKAIEIIPAHIFTPFFGIFGEKSKFTSLSEALGGSRDMIYAIESGLSADPLMVRRISELNRFTILSNSDSHSTSFHRLGREATVLYLNKMTYQNIINSIRKSKIVKTYEYKPSAGRYYYDGHRRERHSNNQGYFSSPRLNLHKCPYCSKNITKGVLSQVYKLADQNISIQPKFQYIVPLLHLITTIKGDTEYNRKNLTIYYNLLYNNDGEYNIWEGRSNFEGIPRPIINAICRVREGNFWYIPGYDANYGKLQFNKVY